jgi:acyl carrier protein
MTNDDLEGRVRSVLADVFGLEPDAVGPDTSTDTVEAWDSLQHLAVVLSLEEEFDIHFDDEETLAVVSYPLITAILREHLGISEPG